ncbi:MAG: hypothetical protein HC847_27100 [Hydrococcus sp. RU_2_2]|nr:hypothetical protein [Hydrococcus sp. RU_2_2]NJP22115.1 hypothetical protein [Hydrococcus sp. CRU_1_1]
MISAFSLLQPLKILPIRVLTILAFGLSLNWGMARQAQAQLGANEQVSFTQVRQENEIEQVVIKQVKVLGNTVFSQQELDTATKPFMGQEATLENAFAIRSAITQL